LPDAKITIKIICSSSSDEKIVKAQGPVVDRLDAITADAAALRIAEVLATDTRLVNRPLYRLVSHNVKAGAFTGTVALTDFATYALTIDLLERELIDALARATELTAATLPIRARYLPDAESVTNIGGRLCAGGPLALFAVAPPAGRGRATERAPGTSHPASGHPEDLAPVSAMPKVRGRPKLQPVPTTDVHAGRSGPGNVGRGCPAAPRPKIGFGASRTVRCALRSIGTYSLLKKRRTPALGAVPAHDGSRV